MTDFSIKENDTAPTIQAQLLDGHNDPKDIRNVQDVVFSLYSVRNDTNIISKNQATVTDLDKAIVEYKWNAGETDVIGHHKGEFELTYKDGTVETFPNNDYIDIYVEEEIQ